MGGGNTPGWGSRRAQGPQVPALLPDTGSLKGEAGGSQAGLRPPAPRAGQTCHRVGSASGCFEGVGEAARGAHCNCSPSGRCRCLVHATQLLQVGTAGQGSTLRACACASMPGPGLLPGACPLCPETLRRQPHTLQSRRRLQPAPCPAQGCHEQGRELVPLSLPSHCRGSGV